MDSIVSLKNIPVFVGSPGDLAQERIAIKDVMARVNRTVCRRGLHFEPLLWEDTVPDFGRPQALINRDVNKCLIFIGMLWKEWGQPTGKYSSGFEEEFKIARARCIKTDNPKIWLMFKKVNPDLWKDPGEEFKKVKDFRQKQKDSKEIKFCEFEDSRDLENRINDYLYDYAFTQFHEPTAPSIPPSEMSLDRKKTVSVEFGIPIEIGTPRIREGEDAWQSQLQEVLSNLNSKIAEVDAMGSPAAVSSFDKIRLYLYSASLIGSELSRKLLGSHEINLLYIHRQELEISTPEREVIAQTIFSNIHDIIPGWYWWQGLDTNQTIAFVANFAASEYDQAARLGAIRLLTEVGIRPSNTPLSADKFYRGLIHDESEEISKAGMKYLAATGTTEDMPVLDDFFQSGTSSHYRQALITKLRILLTTDPHLAFREILKSEDDAPVDILRDFEKASADIPDDDLITALVHPGVGIRILAIRQLAERDKITNLIFPEKMDTVLR